MEWNPFACKELQVIRYSVRLSSDIRKCNLVNLKRSSMNSLYPWLCFFFKLSKGELVMDWNYTMLHKIVR